MIGKLLLCGLSSLVLLAAAPFAATAFLPATANGVITGVSSDVVPKIICYGEGGGGAGTGFRVGPRLVVTAAHGASIGTCFIDGERVRNVVVDKVNDYAVVETSPRAHWLRISCEPMKFGHKYYAFGYAHGGPLYLEEVYGTLRHPLPRSVQEGFGDTGLMVGDEYFIPGMSGGPVAPDDDPRPVAIVIGYNTGVPVSYARFLADTPLCAQGIETQRAETTGSVAKP